jgi:replicative DNA helicase
MLDFVNCSGGIDKIKKEDFFSPVHQIIFEGMRKLLEKKGAIIDLVTLVEVLKSQKKLETVGGVAYLNSINDAVPSVSNFRHYVDIVKKNSVLRKLNTVGKAIQEQSYVSDDEQITLSDAEHMIFDIARQDEHKELTPIRDELPLVLGNLDEIRKDPSKIYGIRTGFYGIDDLTNGLHGGELVILAARPGIGKTSLGLNMILNAANIGKKCAIFSLEMSKQSLVRRALCSLAKVSSYKAGRGELSTAEWQRLLSANDMLDTFKIYIDDNSEITPQEIRRKCMRLQREHGLDFVMVDYLGLMAARLDGKGGANRFENRQTEVAANSRAMKVLAKELDIPVLLLAQLNRETVSQKGKKNTDKRPQLHHLRESGAIEQDADIVMFIHMENTEPTESDDEDETEPLKEGEVVRAKPWESAPKASGAGGTPAEAEIIIAKHRNGPCGFVKVAWAKEYTTFTNAPKMQVAQDALSKISPPKKK